MRLLVVLLATLALGGHAEARKTLRLGASAPSGALTPEGGRQEQGLEPSLSTFPQSPPTDSSDLASDGLPAVGLEEELPQSPSTSLPTTSVLHILTDFGEETDDEAMATAACQIALTNSAMELNIVFLDKKPVSQLATLRLFLGETDWAAVSSATNVKFYRSHDREPGADYTKLDDVAKPFSGSFKDLAKKTTDEKQDMTRHYEHYVLQVGPVHAPDEVYPQGWEEYMKGLDATYSYALLGNMGGTLNSKKDAYQAAKALWDSATVKAVVDTARGQGAFKFTYAAMKDAFPEKEALLNHIVKIGFRNTVGRAASGGGKFVANLVATQASSANFQTVKAVEGAILASASGGSKQEVSVADKANIAVVVDKYYEALTTGRFVPLEECDELRSKSTLGKSWPEIKDMCAACFVGGKPPNIKPDIKKDDPCPECAKGAFCNFAKTDGTLNGPANPTKNMVKDGYTYILTTLKEQFGVPIDLVVSGEPGKWEKNWDDVDKLVSDTALDFTSTYSKMTNAEFDAAIRKSFKEWDTRVQALAIPMTPNYDSVGLIYILKVMRISPGPTLNDLFEVKTPTKTPNRWQLRPAYVKDPNSFGELLHLLPTKAVAAAAASPSPSSSPEAFSE